MLIIEIAATNGAHRNQTGNFSAVPDGWAIVPLELEAEAMGYLPYIDLTVSDGVITAVAQGTIRAIRRLQFRHRGRVRRDLIGHHRPHQPDGRGSD